MGSPRSRTSPVWARAMVSAILTSVVLPAPFGPRSPKVLPASTERFTFCSAQTSRRDHHRRNVFVKRIASKATDIRLIIGFLKSLPLNFLDTKAVWQAVAGQGVARGQRCCQEIGGLKRTGLAVDIEGDGPDNHHTCARSKRSGCRVRPCSGS